MVSWEATNWVMDKSANKGAALFCLLLIANDMNSEGWGSFPTVSKLARLLRQPARTVTRILHRLEASGELICAERGTGRERTKWVIPGVKKDGYADGARDVKLTPLGSQIAIPGVTERHPSPDNSTSVPLVYPSKLSTEVSPPPPRPAEPGGGGGLAAIHGLGNHTDDLIEWLRENVPSLDDGGIARLIKRCQKARAGVTAADIVRVCSYKLATADGARNRGGLLIATVPAILAGEKRVMPP